MAKKRIAVLTSGGDSPGMNCAIRTVVRVGLEHNFDVYGIYRGYAGLLEEDFVKMNVRSVSHIINRGGTMLHSSRCTEMLTEEGQKKAADICRAKKLDAVICIGGDGTFKGAKALSDQGINVFCIPATIDNDLGCSDYTIGFETAVETAVNLADKVRDTTASHDRCSIVEVMGRRCGDLALYTAIAVGAFSVLVPEIPFDLHKDIIDPMLNAKEDGRTHFIIIVAEGVGKSGELAKTIEKETGFTTRAAILGHVQRGGTPVSRDRVIAALMGTKAIELIKNGASNRVICVSNGNMYDRDINEALSMTRVFSQDLYNIAKSISK